MLSLKLAEKEISVWRDVGQLRAGDDWRDSIEQGIFESDAVVVALSPWSAESAHVTFEWAYALGLGKTLIPVKLGECKLHPKIEPIQYFDFTYPRALPWGELMQRIVDIEQPPDEPVVAVTPSAAASVPVLSPDVERDYVARIMDYLTRKGFRMASFERLSETLGIPNEPGVFEQVIENNRRVFRPATLKHGNPGLAKLMP